MQHRDQHDRHRLAEVQGFGGPGEDRARVAQVRVEVGGGAFPGAGEQGARVREDEGVVVDVDDPAVRRGGLGHFMGVVRGGQPGADVQELADALGPGQVPDRPGEKRPVSLR